MEKSIILQIGILFTILGLVYIVLKDKEKVVLLDSAKTNSSGSVLQAFTNTKIIGKTVIVAGNFVYPYNIMLSKETSKSHIHSEYEHVEKIYYCYPMSATVIGINQNSICVSLHNPIELDEVHLKTVIVHYDCVYFTSKDTFI